jgi:glycerol transport system ATP-binding protein
MAEIRVENVSHTYGRDVEAISGVSMTMEDGKLTALLGPSGCGKTTLLRIIAGLLRPTEGKIYFDGEDMTLLPAEDRNVAMVFQFPVVYIALTVYENLALPLRAKGMPENEIKMKIKEISEFLGMTEYLNQKASKLTIDRKQITALARAMVREDSNVLILDEPLTSVSPKARLELREKILEYKNLRAKTIVYVTHDQSEALTLGDKIGVMKDGKLLQYESPEVLYSKPASTFIASFIGNPGMNLAELRYEKDKRGPKLVSGDFKLEIDSEIANKIEQSNINELTLGIRPEHIEISEEKREGFYEADCEMEEDWGNLKVLTARVKGLSFRIKTSHMGIRAGDKIWIHFPSEKIRIFGPDGYLVY